MKLFRISINASVFFLILSGIIHSVSFIVQPQPENDTERQMLDLVNTFKMDMGAGFIRTFHQIFLFFSACFTLILFFGGILLYYLNKNNISKQLMAGTLNIYLVFYGILYILLWTLAFLPPILCMTFVFVSLVFSRWSINSLEK